ncbi:MAG: serine/threonine-protein kinase [Anaerolineae bacterium]
MTQEQILLSDRYRLLAKIDQDETAVTFTARDMVLGRLVTVTVLVEQLTDDEALWNQFRDEVGQASTLSHPHIAHIYDAGKYQGRGYIVSEYMPGQTLAQLLSEEAPLALDRTLNLLCQACFASAYAHRMGQTHGRLAPQNVHVGSGDQVKVTGFGLRWVVPLALAFAKEKDAEPFTYLAPEVAAGEPPSAAADVYTLGAILHQMLTGETPIRRGGRARRPSTGSREAILPSLTKRRLPRQLQLIISKALAEDPQARYPTAQELERVLRAYCHRREREAIGQEVKEKPAPEQKVVFVPQPQIDWVAVVLATLATLAVLGLIPLWILVYRRYALPPTPTPLVHFLPDNGAIASLLDRFLL